MKMWYPKTAGKQERKISNIIILITAEIMLPPVCLHKLNILLNEFLSLFFFLRKRKTMRGPQPSSISGDPGRRLQVVPKAPCLHADQEHSYLPAASGKPR